MHATDGRRCCSTTELRQKQWTGTGSIELVGQSEKGTGCAGHIGRYIVKFPSLSSVEHLKAMLDASGLDWTYTAGNRDWHYEGEPGTSFAQGEKWQQANLKPLYQGRNPLCSAQVIHGINFVTIDNSLFEITEEQLKFFGKQVGKGTSCGAFHARSCLSRIGH